MYTGLPYISHTTMRETNLPNIWISRRFPAILLSSCISQNIFFHMIGNESFHSIFWNWGVTFNISAESNKIPNFSSLTSFMLIHHSVTLLKHGLFYACLAGPRTCHGILVFVSDVIDARYSLASMEEFDKGFFCSCSLGYGGVTCETGANLKLAILVSGWWCSHRLLSRL